MYHSETAEPQGESKEKMSNREWEEGVRSRSAEGARGEAMKTLNAGRRPVQRNFW